MKRVIPIILLLICLLSPLSTRLEVNAEEGADLYAVAAQRNVWLYAQENEDSGLFILPYTYYVKILRRGSVFCAVQYLDDTAPYRSVIGYCRTEELTFVDFIPVRPYLRREITVTYTVESPTGSLLGKGAFDRLEKTFVYYGMSYSGTAKFFYVYADGVFDYVPATQEVVYDLNTDYLAPAAGGVEDGGSSSELPQEGLSGLQIAVICIAAVAVAAIALFVLRGKRPVSSQQQEFSEF